MYIDSHAHFDLCLEDKGVTEKDLISSLRDNNIKHAIQISIDADNLEWSYEFAKKHDNILFTLGIHPSSRASENELALLTEFVKKITESSDSELLFGIGETGLDFYRMRQPKDHQINSFEYQIETAKEYRLPLIVHSRDAFTETLEILQRKKPHTGIMHCFPGDSGKARKILDLGFYISFAGHRTYKKALGLQDAASYVPLDRLLLETDAPFLTPIPLRGKKNKSEYVIHTYQFLSELRKESLSKIEEAIFNNFSNLNKR